MKKFLGFLFLVVFLQSCGSTSFSVLGVSGCVSFEKNECKVVKHHDEVGKNIEP